MVSGDRDPTEEQPEDETRVAGARSHCDLVVHGGRMLDLELDEGVRDGAAIAVLDGVIVDVGEDGDIAASWAPDRRIDASGQVIAPGFVDGHVHLSAFLGAGRPYVPAVGPGPFSGAGRVEVILPMIAELVTMPVPPELAYAVVRPMLAAMLRSGITGVVDAGSSGLDGVVWAADEVGIRASIGPSLVDQWHDGSGTLTRQADADQLLAGADQFADRYDGAGDGRIRAMVSAVETMACSDELLAGISQLAEQRDLPTHVHSHISDRSVQAHVEAFGRTPTQRLSAAGMLSARCTVMHAGSLTDDDIASFQQAGVTVNHNPVGNAMLGFGVTGGLSVPRLMAAGVPIVLGSDFSPSTVSTPFDMIRATLLLHRDLLAADNAITLEQALAMATNGATPLGRPGMVGRIAIGQVADVVLLDTAGLHHMGVDHPVPALALHGRAADVTTVIVAGRPIIEDKAFLRLDEHAMTQAAREAFATIARHT